MNTSKFAEFMAAQEEVYDDVVAELKSGRKETHWMWFIFPQLAGLGSSAMARKFALATEDEARAYLAHSVLGRRLLECTRLLLALDETSPAQIFGHPDDLKLHSCLTLFSAAAPDEPLFQSAIDKYFHGKPDVKTLQLLGRTS